MTDFVAGLVTFLIILGLAWGVTWWYDNGCAGRTFQGKNLRYVMVTCNVKQP